MPVSTLPCPSRFSGPFSACCGFNDPALFLTSNHLQTTFKPSSNEHSSPYSKFHTLANCHSVSIRVNSCQFALKRFWGNQVAPPSSWCQMLAVCELLDGSAIVHTGANASAVLFKHPNVGLHVSNF